MKNSFKLILLILLILSVTGCDIKYKLSFNSNNISEEISINNMKKNNDGNDLALSLVSSFFLQFHYDTSFVRDKYNYIAKQTWDDFDELNEYSILISDLYDTNGIKISNNKVYLDFSINDKIRKYIYLYGDVNSVQLSLYVPYYVSKHNADSVSDNTYTWNFDDLENANLKINFDMSKSYKYKNFLSSMFVIGSLSVIIVALIIYFVKRNRDVNKI